MPDLNLSVAWIEGEGEGGRVGKEGEGGGEGGGKGAGDGKCFCEENVNYFC